MALSSSGGRTLQDSTLHQLPGDRVNPRRRRIGIGVGAFAAIAAAGVAAWKHWSAGHGIAARVVGERFLSNHPLADKIPVRDHGIAAAVSQSAWSGPALGSGARGERLLVLKLWASPPRVSTYLTVDVSSGASVQTDPGSSDYGAYFPFLNTRSNRFYDTLDSQLVEFDPVTGQVLRLGRIPEGFASSFTVDDTGVLFFSDSTRTRVCCLSRRRIGRSGITDRWRLKTGLRPDHRRRRRRAGSPHADRVRERQPDRIRPAQFPPRRTACPCGSGIG